MYGTAIFFFHCFVVGPIVKVDQYSGLEHILSYVYTLYVTPCNSPLNFKHHLFKTIYIYIYIHEAFPIIPIGFGLIGQAIDFSMSFNKLILQGI